jgi:hypothetical protein
MAEPPVTLDADQRAIVDQTIRDHCRIRGWTQHVVNPHSNYVHGVASAEREPGEVMCEFKAWCSRRLSGQAGLTQKVAVKAGRRRWWTEHGSKKCINSEDYLPEAIEYALERQG